MSMLPSIAEPVTQLHDDFPGVNIMSPAEAVAVVDQVFSIAQVQCTEGDRPAFADRFADGKVDCRVGGQVPGPVSIEKARSIGSGCNGPRAPGQGQRQDAAQSVTLIVVKEEISYFR